MHIHDGIIPTTAVAAGYAAAIPITWYSVRKINQKENPRQDIPKASLLTAADFPVMVQPSSHDLAAFDFSTGVNIQWTNLANGTNVGGVDVNIWGDTFYNTSEYDILSTQTSIFIDTSGHGVTNMSGATVALASRDIYERRYKSYWNIAVME